MRKDIFALLALGVASDEVACPTPAYPNTRCQYYEDCFSVETNSSIDFCVSKGNEACQLFTELGTTGAAFATSQCSPSQGTCCDLYCCSLNQVCTEQQSGTFYYNFVAYDVEEIARNNWKLPDGTPLENKPRVCVQDENFHALAGAKAVYIPLGGIIVMVLAILGAYSQNAEALLSAKAIPALVMLATAFFLLFSVAWLYGLISVLIALLTVLAPAKMLKYVLLVQVFLFWTFVGGSSLFFGQSPNTNFFAAVNGQTSLAALATACSNFYDYFKYNAATRGWWVSTERATWGYCSVEWLGFETIMSLTNTMAFFLLLVQTSLAVILSLEGKKEPLLATAGGD